jgi:hypothetical protein
MTVLDVRTGLLVVVLVLAGGCLTDLSQSDRPDPSAIDYHVEADGPPAPHAVTYEGTVAGFHADRIDTTLAPATLRVVPAPIAGEPGDPASPAPAVAVQNASGTFTHEDGSTERLDGTDVGITSNRSAEVTGVDEVAADHLRLQDQRLVVPAPPGGPGPNDGPDPTRPPNVTMATGEGARVDGIELRDLERDRALGPGTLELDPGTYAVTDGALAVEPPGPVDLDGADAQARLQDPDRPVELAGEVHEVDDVRLEARSLDATLHPGEHRVELDAAVDQWHEGSVPRLEAALAARVVDANGTPVEPRLEVDRGGNATGWIELAETAGTATAPGVEPDLADGPLEAAYTPDWYRTPDPGLVDRAGTFLKNLALGLFIDFTVTDLDPGESKFIGLGVHAPEDVDPGTYEVEASFVAGNAKADPLTVTVDVR